MLKLNHLTGFGSGASGIVGTSYLLDGTTDFLDVPDHADFRLGGGTGNFTLELWIRYVATGSVVYFMQGDTASDQWSFHIGGGNLQFQTIVADSSTVILAGAWAPSTGVWYHLACIRGWNGNANDWAITVDGATVDTTTNSSTVPDITDELSICARGRDGADSLNGYFDEVRISDTARWTADFSGSLPTEQYTSDANTLLLIHGGEAYTGALTGETTQSCVALDGVNDYLTVPDHADWSFGAGDFTIDFLIKFNDKTNAMFIMSQDLDGSTNYWYISKSSDASGSKLKIKFRASSVTLAQYTMTGNWSVSDNTWYHIAFVRSTTSILLFIDGVSEALTEDTAVSTNDVGNVAAVLSIGVLGSTGTGDVDGMFSELRISDTARWTSGFTPSTTRYTSDANTVLLIHGDENGGGTAAFTDSGNTGHTVTPTGDAFLGNGGTFTDSGNTGHTVSENGNAIRDTTVYKF